MIESHALRKKEQASSGDSGDEDSCVWDGNCSIFTGKGRLYVRLDSKVFRFSSSKNESLFKQRKNPRKIAWTVVYRRVNRKGVSEEVAKKRSRKTVKANRGVGGLSLADITARRSQSSLYRFISGGGIAGHVC